MARILQSLIARADERQFFPTQGNATHFAAEAKENIGHLPGLKLKCIEENEEEEFAEGIVVVESLSGKKITFPERSGLIGYLSPHVRGSITVLESGFYAVDSKFQIVIVSGISNFSRCIPRGTQWICSSKHLFFRRIIAAGRFAKNKICPSVNSGYLRGFDV